jgi:hypothetical protein
MKVVFAEIAKIELDNAFGYYELEMPGLGEDLRKKLGKQ